MKTINAVYMNSPDNCVTLTGNADAGDTVRFLDGERERTITAGERIPVWHKMAINPVEKGGSVYKYGAAIGIALERIEAGNHVHTHNVRSPGIGA